ncbi:MAG: rhodanese-like domain-containing protein [Balneolaceae bacterium]|nr:rhodanese-like domain-containing protein [Balneolaceae bacterium]MCR9131923.1 rhodanese-like domain-containing protein [bacterium]
MFNFIKKALTPTEEINFKQLQQEGATIIDVRTPSEYQSGHVQGSKNIPLQQLPSSLDSLNPHKTIIVCCASGARSGSAKRMLNKAGYDKVYNGGGWMQLQNKLHE